MDVLESFADDAYFAARDAKNAEDEDDADGAKFDLLPFIHLREQIQKRFLEAVDNPKHFEKVQWFAAYWNRKIGLEHAMLLVKGPGTLP